MAAVNRPALAGGDVERRVEQLGVRRGADTGTAPVGIDGVAALVEGGAAWLRLGGRSDRLRLRTRRGRDARRQLAVFGGDLRVGHVRHRLRGGGLGAAFKVPGEFVEGPRTTVRLGDFDVASGEGVHRGPVERHLVGGDHLAVVFDAHVVAQNDHVSVGLKFLLVGFDHQVAFTLLQTFEAGHADVLRGRERRSEEEQRGEKQERERKSRGVLGFHSQCSGSGAQIVPPAD